MNAPAEIPSISNRFNAFHLAVAVYVQRVSWLLEQMDHDQTPLYMIEELTEQLDRLIDEQDCRENHLIEANGNC